jgi:3-hydroxyacyl-CoA dehydrogenase
LIQSSSRHFVSKLTDGMDGRTMGLVMIDRILDIVTRFVAKQKLPPQAVEVIMRPLTTTTTYDNFDKMDLVVEAVIENVKVLSHSIHSSP